MTDARCRRFADDGDGRFGCSQRVAKIPHIEYKEPVKHY